MGHSIGGPGWEGSGGLQRHTKVLSDLTLVSLTVESLKNKTEQTQHNPCLYFYFLKDHSYSFFSFTTCGLGLLIFHSVTLTRLGEQTLQTSTSSDDHLKSPCPNGSQDFDGVVRELSSFYLSTIVFSLVPVRLYPGAFLTDVPTKVMT